MFELLAAFAAVIAVLFVSYFRGRSGKQAALARALATPQTVARIYLRHAPEMGACWLHVAFRDGKKAVLASPWEVAETLDLLKAAGLQLGEDDAAWWTSQEAERASRESLTADEAAIAVRTSKARATRLRACA